MKDNKIYILLIVFIVTLISLCFDYSKINYSLNINKTIEVMSYDDVDNPSIGTGWFIDKTIIVTNAHVISYEDSGCNENYNNINIRFSFTKEYEEVTIKYVDYILDIAFLKYEGNTKHKYFRTRKKYKTGEKCFSIGNFNNNGLSYKEGNISLKAVNLDYNDNLSEYIQCLLPIGKGDSGSPLINKYNKVIGMLSFRQVNNSGFVEECFSYAIPIYRIIEIYNAI